MSHCCAHCNKPSATSKCSACQLPYYCNTSCQSSHWKSVHKKQCKFFRQNSKPQHQLDTFLQSIKTNYISMDKASPQTKNEESEVFKKHNQTMQSLLYFAKKIQRSNTLSSTEKLSQSQKIADEISEYDYSLSRNLDNIPSELFANNDDSLLIKCSLKNHRPSKEVIQTIISDIYSKRLKLNDAMNVMYYTMDNSITNDTLEVIVNGLNFALNNLDLLSGVFGVNDVVENKEAELADVTKIVTFIDTDFFPACALTDEHRPNGCSDLIRFDCGYQLKHVQDNELLMHGYIRNINTKKYIIPKEIICLCKRFCDTIISDAVYAGKLNVISEYGDDECMIGSHYGTTWNMDCSGDLFAWTGAGGYKMRSNLIEEFFMNPAKNYEMDRIRSWRGLSSPSNMIFCDNIYNTIWVAGDDRIKCSGVIENGKDTTYEEYDLSCDHILSCSGIKGSKTLFVTEEKIFVYSAKGTFYVWDWNKLNDHCTDICTETYDDDSIPEVDEHGVKTEAYNVFEAGPYDDCATYEVSGGQCYMDTVTIDTQFVNNIKLSESELSICDDMNKFDESLFIANENVIYKYNMEKNMFYGTLLGHNVGSVHLPFRQYLLEDNLLVSHDYGLVKVWDVRINEAVFSIKGSGNYKLMTAIGFGNNYIASGGGDEAVTIWDLKHPSALYEISAGNNVIKQIVWHKPSASLIAASDTGIYSDYWGNGRSDYEEVKWPKDAVHQKDDFPKELDSN
eukprot:197580_1